MLDLSTWLPILGSALGLAGLLGAALVYAKGKRWETIISLQDKEIKVVREKADRLDAAHNACQTRLEALEGVVTGATAVGELAKTLATSHAELIARLDKLLRRRK